MTRICLKCFCEKPFSYFQMRKEGYFRLACKECMSIHHQGYRKNNLEKIRAKRREAYNLNKADILEKNKAWKRANEERRRQYVLNREKMLRREKPGHALRKDIPRRILLALKGETKSASTLKLLGCSYEELRAHLQNQFRPGMTWETHGLWHIDHKRPCASFDLTDPAQQRECFHYTNLQPLWALENIQKSDKIT